MGVLTTVLFLGVYLGFRTALPTTGAVTVAGTGGSLDELGVLIVASAVAGVVRFALMGRWVFPATA